MLWGKDLNAAGTAIYRSLHMAVARNKDLRRTPVLHPGEAPRVNPVLPGEGAIAGQDFLACDNSADASTRSVLELLRLCNQESQSIGVCQHRLALAKVPGATVRSVELEREHGRLIYSFDLHVLGQSGVEEGNVRGNCRYGP